MTWIAIAVGGSIAITAAAVEYQQNDQALKDKKVHDESVLQEAQKNGDPIRQNLTEAERLAGHMSLQGLPEEQKQQRLSELQRDTAYNLQQSRSRKGGLIGIGQLEERNNGVKNDMMAQDAAVRMGNQRYGNQLVAGARGAVVDYNNMTLGMGTNMYNQNQAADAANRGALLQSIGNQGQLAQSAGMSQGGGQRSQPAQQQSSPYYTNAQSSQYMQPNMYNYNERSMNGRDGYSGSQYYNQQNNGYNPYSLEDNQTYNS